MLKLVAYDQTRIQEIASVVSEAFMAEEGTYALFLDRKNCEAYMRCVIAMLVKSHCLYELEEGEGWIAYYDKKHTIGMLSQLQFATEVMFAVDLGQYEKVTRAMQPWVTSEKRFEKLKDYLSVFLVCVPKEKQGKGNFRKMMQMVFAQCAQRGIPCILDTDSACKKEKYEHLGMECVASMELEGGAEQYSLIYYPKNV